MIAVVTAAEQQLAEQLLDGAQRHAGEAELFHTANRLAAVSARNAGSLLPFARRYEPPARPVAPPLQLPPDIQDPHVGELIQLRLLHVLATGVVLDWTALGQGAAAARDHELSAAVATAKVDASRTVKWTKTLLSTSAPQALTS